MSERLSIVQIAILCAYASGMAGGQLLFKAASLRIAADGSMVERLLGLLQNGFFLLAMAIYLGLSVVWVWVLSFTPLSRAYPFVALAFAITPFLGGMVFSEPISLRLILGVVIILCGLLLVAG